MTNTNTRKLIYTITCVAMNVALITICSWISIPYVISFTMQTFAIFLISALFSWKVSILSVLAYILLGMVGVPGGSGGNSRHHRRIYRRISLYRSDRQPRHPCPRKKAVGHDRFHAGGAFRLLRFRHGVVYGALHKE